MVAAARNVSLDPGQEIGGWERSLWQNRHGATGRAAGIGLPDGDRAVGAAAWIFLEIYRINYIISGSCNRSAKYLSSPSRRRQEKSSQMAQIVLSWTKEDFSTGEWRRRHDTTGGASSVNVKPALFPAAAGGQKDSAG
jgi:ribosomal protein L32